MKKLLLMLMISSTLFGAYAGDKKAESKTGTKDDRSVVIDLGKLIGNPLDNPFLDRAKLDPTIFELNKDRGGSDIGGGNLDSSLLAWYSDSEIILEEAQEQARDLWGFQGDSVGAIRLFYNGLLEALNASSDPNINWDSSILYKSIARGIGLSQILNIPELLNGQTILTARVGEMLHFLDWYYSEINQRVRTLDRDLFVPYHRCHRQCPELSMEKLERELINYSLGQLDKWMDSFVKNKSNGLGLFPLLDAKMVLAGLGFLAVETANDLESSLFNKVYILQSTKLKRMAADIQHFLSNRNSNNMDAIMLNKYVLKTRKILSEITRK